MRKEDVGRCFELRGWYDDKDYSYEYNGICIIKIFDYDEFKNELIYERVWAKGDMLVRNTSRALNPIGNARPIELRPDEYNMKLRWILNKVFGDSIKEGYIPIDWREE